jgi:hypothetical protein
MPGGGGFFHDGWARHNARGGGNLPGIKRRQPFQSSLGGIEYQKSQKQGFIQKIT